MVKQLTLICQVSLIPYESAAFLHNPWTYPGKLPEGVVSASLVEPVKVLLENSCQYVNLALISAMSTNLIGMLDRKRAECNIVPLPV